MPDTGALSRRQRRRNRSLAPAAVPDAPTIGTATAGDTTATANWTAPASNGGSAITGYEVKTYQASNDALLETNTVGVVLTFQDTGRTNGVGVYFKVAAINAVGTGSQSAASNTVTPAAAAAPPSSGKVFHFDASTLANANATLLASWPNGGSGGAAAQAVGANQPGVFTNQLNGLRTVTFAAQDFMKTPAVAAMAQPCHHFYVANILGANAYVADGLDSSNRQALLQAGAAGMGIYAGGAGAISAASATPTGYHRWRCLFDGTDTLHRDGVAFASGDAGSHALTGLTLGSNFAGASAASNCQIAEVIVYSRALTAGEITTVEAYLTAKWGV